MDERFCKVGDVELCYETFGDRGDPAMLLIMGLGTQMIAWPEEFCRMLAQKGFFVIRYDNRDVGRSTRFDGAPTPKQWEMLRRKPKRVAYGLADMAGDGVGLLDELGIQSAHVVGASMGGMIGQVLAARHPERVLSFTSIMSTTGSRWRGRPALRALPKLLARPKEGKEAYVERLVRLFRVVGSPGFERDEDALRRLAGQAYDRGVSNAGLARQLAAINASGHRKEDLRGIKAPTLVIHGTKDRLVKRSGGKATAKAIPEARLMMIEGMGHDLPPGAWPRIVEGIVKNAARAREAAHSRAA
ncbi:MAG: alpha/beta fold hydrolase [Thermoleophilaceae bacterium]